MQTNPQSMFLLLTQVKVQEDSEINLNTGKRKGFK